MQTALSRGDLNLGEAAQMARLTPDRLDTSSQKATALRAEVLRHHLLLRGTQSSLQGRVQELLGEVVTLSSAAMTEVVHKIDELLEIDPSDNRHLFYEEMKRLFYAMREIQPEDIDDTSLDEIMKSQISCRMPSTRLK